MLTTGIDIKNFYVIIALLHAALAHPVERHLAKVEVASSSLVSRSNSEAVVYSTASFFLSDCNSQITVILYLYNPV